MRRYQSPNSGDSSAAGSQSLTPPAVPDFVNAPTEDFNSPTEPPFSPKSLPFDIDAAPKDSDDPLRILCYCIRHKKQIRYDNDQWLYFDKLKPIHITTKCGFRLGKELLDIGSIWWMYYTNTGEHSYTPESTAKFDFKYINIGVRSDLSDWLHGVTANCKGLDMTMIEGKKRAYGADAAKLNEKGPDELGAVSKRARSDTKITKEDYDRFAHPVHQLNDYVCTGTKLHGADEMLAFAKDMLSKWETPAVQNKLNRIWEEEHGQDDMGESETSGNEDSGSEGDVSSDDSVNMDLAMPATPASAASEREERPKQKKGTQPLEKLQSVEKLPLHVELEGLMRQDENNIPIILLPCNKQAPVNMLNVKEFLENGIYVVPDNNKLITFESIRPEVINITRNLGGKVWQFEIRDSTKRFTKQMWKRTVAVVLDGTDWQFRGWPFETVLDMLTTLKGIYFQISGHRLHEHVDGWACEKLELPPMQMTHRFASVRDEFFEALGAFFNSYRVTRFKSTQLKETVMKVRKPAIL